MMENVGGPNDQRNSVGDSSATARRALEDAARDAGLGISPTVLRAEQGLPERPRPLNAAELASMFATLASETPDASTWSTSYAGARRILATIEQLESLVYVPGLWKCAKCGCATIASVMCASTGRMAANREPQQCPNECGPMWRVTERKAGNDLADRLALTDLQRAEILAAQSWLKHPPGANPVDELTVALHHLKTVIAVALR